MKKIKKRVYVDMDGVMCDIKKAIMSRRLRPATHNEEIFPQSKIGFFLTMDPMEGAIEAIFELDRRGYEVWFLTRPSYINANCYTEKALWIRNNLGMKWQERLIICPNKSLVKGDYLVDDHTADGQLDFEGELLHFGEDNKFKDWKMVLDYLV